MSKVQIPIGKGSFQNVDDFELGGSPAAAELLNCHINEAGSNVDRPALSVFATIGSFPVQALRFFKGKLFAVTENDRAMWEITRAGVVSNVTGLELGGSARPVFDDDGTYLAIAGGGRPQRWSGSGLTELMPGDSGDPEECTHINYLDGYWINFLPEDPEFRFAGPLPADREDWDDNDFFQAEKQPGELYSQIVTKAGSELFGIKAKSTQIFQNFGDDPAAPFKPVFTIPKGTMAGYSVVEADNTLFWFDSVERRFVKLEGRNPVDIGTPYDRVVKKFETVNDCWAAKLDIEGQYLVAWTFPTEERVLVFDYKTQDWSEWTGFRDAQNRRFRMHSYCHASDWNMHFIGDPITGTIWQASRAFKTDGTDVFRRLRRTGVYDHGTSNRKRNIFYDFEVKRGLGASLETEPVMTVRFKDDDEPWSDPYQVGLGSVGQRLTKVRLKNTGIYTSRQIEISITDPVDFVLHKIEEEVEELAF